MTGRPATCPPLHQHTCASQQHDTSRQSTLISCTKQGMSAACPPSEPGLHALCCALVPDELHQQGPPGGCADHRGVGRAGWRPGVWLPHRRHSGQRAVGHRRLRQHIHLGFLRLRVQVRKHASMPCKRWLHLVAHVDTCLRVYSRQAVFHPDPRF